MDELPPQVEAQLDDMRLYIARESCSVDMANRVVENICDRFRLLAKHPRMGRLRPDLAPDPRSFGGGAYVTLYSTEEDDDIVTIHSIVPRRGGH